MLVTYAVMGIYLSFVVELLVWRVPSEASTYRMLKHQRSFFSNFRLIIFSAFIVIYYLCPLVFVLFLFYSGTALKSSAFAFLGFLLAVLGRVLSMGGAIQLNANPSSNLIRKSVFRWSRNPITLGLHFTLLGLMMILKEWYLFSGFIFYFGYFQGKIKIEERSLTDRFGKEYQDYCKRTPRYFGYV